VGFSAIGLSIVKMNADRHRHVAYHKSTNDMLFNGINTDDLE